MISYFNRIGNSGGYPGMRIHLGVYPEKMLDRSKIDG
jgi:hypothetical protein